MKSIIKKNNFFKKMIIALLPFTSLASLAFVPNVSQKIEKQNCALVKIENDKSLLVEKPILYQFETKAINCFPNTIPLKYEKIDWNLPLHVLVNSLDSFDGNKYFKDYLMELCAKFDCLPCNGKKHNFIAVINLINHLENSLNNKIAKSNYQIEYYKWNKEKLLAILNDFAKDGNLDDLDMNKMNLAKIKWLIISKYGVSASELDGFTYEELVKMCKSNLEVIKEIDEAINFCEEYKSNCQSKLDFLSGKKKELIDSLYKFVDMWKANSSWYKNYDSMKEMVKEMKKDYEKNKETILNNSSKNDLCLLSLMLSILDEEPIFDFPSFSFLW